MNRYSLWSEPWIPVVNRAGQSLRLSLRDTLVQSPQLLEVFDPSPLVEVAIIRLLQAIVYRVFGLQDEDEWAALWKAGAFDVTWIDRYGDQFADCFDLLHPTKPFYQVLKMDGATEHPIRALVIEAASGNNATLFDHGQAEGRDWLQLDRVACHLLAQQAFAFGGGKSDPFNLMDAALTKGMVVQAVGRNLFESLMLNSFPLTRWESHIPELEADQPFWEIEQPPIPQRKGTHPLGPMHYLTWQSRQVHILLDESAERAVGCQIRQRYAFPDTGEKREPYMPYYMSEKMGWQPLKLDKQRAVWQYTHAFLQTTQIDREQSAPFLTNWLATVVSDRFASRHSHQLGLPSVISYSVTGMASDRAKIDLWRRERLPIPAVFFVNQNLPAYLSELMLMSRVVEGHLSRIAEALTWALAESKYLNDAIKYVWTGKTKDKATQKSLSSHRALAKSLDMVGRFWSDLAEPFERLLVDLASGNLPEVRAVWRSVLIRAARQSFEDIRDNMLFAENAFAVLAPVDQAFRHRLYSVLKDDAGKEEEMDEKDSGPIE